MDLDPTTLDSADEPLVVGKVGDAQDELPGAVEGDEEQGLAG